LGEQGSEALVAREIARTLALTVRHARVGASLEQELDQVLIAIQGCRV
jgi:hypothetical protein